MLIRLEKHIPDITYTLKIYDIILQHKEKFVWNICQVTETGGMPPVKQSNKNMPPNEAYGHLRLNNWSFPPNR